MAHTLSTVSHKLGSGGRAISEDGLRVTALGCVRSVLGLRKSKNVGPLLKLLGICIYSS